MTAWAPLLPVAILASSLVTGVVIFFLREDQAPLRTTLNLTGAMLKVVLVSVMLWGVYRGATYETHVPLLAGQAFSLRADALSLQFVTLSAGLWLVTTVYAVGYLEGSPDRSRFFGFFSLCVTASTGVALAGNLLTFFVFYEFLTLATYPLVVHRGTPEALRAGNVYLAYTLGGGIMLLIGIAGLHGLGGSLEFTKGVGLEALVAEHPRMMAVLFVVLIAGLGVKAALVPLHGWLPIAMVAPAPVSALLHAVAVVKAGVFGIVRVLFDVYGVAQVQSLGLGRPLAMLAGITIVWGSIQALRQDELKKRLAYSTVSQLSYITLGAALAGPLAMTGALAHLVHQGLMKITLFFCAGVVAETLGLHKVGEMNGIGRRMPWTMTAFTLAALGMIGLPPLAGFVGKWYLATGAIEVGEPWVLAVLVASSLLNAGYFLPILQRVWFEEPAAGIAGGSPHGHGGDVWLVMPPIVTALTALGAGLFAGAPFSPLGWARIITFREYLLEGGLP